MNEYLASRGGGNGSTMNIVLGLIMIAVAVVGIVSGLELVGVFAFTGVIQLVTGFAKLSPLVVFHADHVELKKAPLAPRKFLLFRDIEGIRVESPTAAFVVAQGQETRLPLAWMDEGTRTSLVARFQKETSKSKEATA